MLALALLAGTAAPAVAQDSTVQELRIRQLEAQMRDLQRASGAVRTVAPQNGPVAAPSAPAGAPATSPLTDLLTRMDALEASVARLTAQNEELSNRMRQLQPASAAATPAAAAPVAAAPAPLAPTPVKPATEAPTNANNANLAAMTGQAAASAPAAKPVAAKPAKPEAPAKPSAQRIAAVKAVVKPQTNDPGDDEYSYGFRLYQAKFYPEAAQQLKLFVDKYPKHMRLSQGRNLLGRALLDDGKPREAAPWFLQNYKSDPAGNRAADSLLNLAEAMRQIGDSSRACIALNEFATNYAGEARGRLREQYDKVKGTVTCN
ncbi:MAG: hypothetical protein KGM17_15010 [Sphingomonadales bacterium]|nr:hypothetical protein [Sphingomonadales bacterium]